MCKTEYYSQHTIAELDAPTTISKRIQWLCSSVENVGLPYHVPTFVGEDNSAAQIFGHDRKLSHNIQHIATKTIPLQEQVQLS